MTVDDLRNFTAEDLLGELDRRERALREGRCPRCGREMWSEPSCGSPREHSPVRASPVTVQGTLELVGPKGSGKTVMAEHFRRAARDVDVNLVIVEQESPHERRR